MRALVLEQFGGPLNMTEVPTPTVGPHEALVRVRNVGVCGTDLKIRAGSSSPIRTRCPPATSAWSGPGGWSSWATPRNCPCQ